MKNILLTINLLLSMFATVHLPNNDLQAIAFFAYFLVACFLFAYFTTWSVKLYKFFLSFINANKK